MQYARDGYSYDGGDQGLLNGFFEGKHRWLPTRYNVLRHHAYYAGNVSLNKDDIAIIHYIKKKPWEIKYRESCDAFLVELEDVWTGNLTKDDLLKLIRHWRRDVFIHYEGDMATLRRVKAYMRRMNLAFAGLLAVCALSVVAVSILLRSNG